MTEQELRKLVRNFWEEEADKYESTTGHGIITTEERVAWLADIAEVITIAPGSRCLDVAAGTGVMTRLLAELVGPTGHVTATDGTPNMLARNEELMPMELQSRVDFKIQQADYGRINPDWLQTFDIIACRQGTSGFINPMSAFRRWHRWLKPNGKVLILDGLWTRAAWSTEDVLFSIVDQLPLSCTQTLATVPYLLKKSGFTIEHCALLSRINAWFEKNQPAFECPRFAVVASKRSS